MTKTRHILAGFFILCMKVTISVYLSIDNPFQS